MRLSCWLCVCALVVLPVPTQAQFRIDATLPVSATASIAVEDTIIFEFNAAIAPDTDWNTFFIAEPSDAIVINGVELCLSADGPCIGQDGVPRFARFLVTHEPETDYTWTVFGVESDRGVAMAEPYVLRYSTASDIGRRTVSGSVVTASTTSKLSADLRDVLRMLTARADRVDLGVPAFRRDGQATAEGPLKASTSEMEARRLASGDAAASGPVTRVLLLQAYTKREAGWRVQGSTSFVDLDGAFEIPHVRDGTYWPLVVRYANATFQEIVALGYLDDGADLAPDPLVVSGGDVDGVALTSYAFPLTTAQTYLDEARALALTVSADHQFIQLRSLDGMRPAGTAYAWSYQFYSAQRDEVASITADPLDLTLSTASASTNARAMRPIPASFADSDGALEAALNDGGAAFIAPYRPANLVTIVEGGNLFWKLPAGYDEVSLVWHVRIFAVTGTQVRTFERFLELATATGVEDEVAETARPTGSALGAPYPNPARGPVGLSVMLDQPGPITLRLFDLLGREVAVLADGEIRTRGEHTFRWPNEEVPSGLYVVRLETPRGHQTRTVTVIR